MGMYTELVIKTRVLDNISTDVEEILKYLFSNGECPKLIPNHLFFKCKNWDMIGRSNSYYHVPKTFNFYDGKYLFSRSDLKNYENEIDLFIDWIDPYISSNPGECIGWEWYEENEEPTLLYKK